MKKNRIFLWAYITAICISVVVRLHVEYAQWRAIVWGITVSSAVFSIEDLFSSLCRTIRDTCDLLDKYLTQSKRLSQKDRAFFEQLQEKFISEPEVAKENADIIEVHQSTISKIDEFISCLKLMENKVAEKRKELALYEKCSDILTYAGYLYLFCAVFFSEFVALPDMTLEMLTVLSFATIMVTQQLNQYFSEKINKETETYQNALKKQEDQLKRHPDLERRLNEIIDSQKRLFEAENELKRLTEKQEELEALEYAD